MCTGLIQRKQESWNLQWEYVKWQSTKDVNATLGAMEDQCVGLGGLFPGLRWRGAFLAVSAYLQPALSIFDAANILQTYAIGKDTPYLAGTSRPRLQSASHRYI
jgi:hypothetical protein